MNHMTQSAPEIEIFLLGTGGPEFTASRSGISTLIKANHSYFLFDTGRGTAQRIYECSIPFHEINRIFYTHIHSDHIEGLPTLWMSPWFLVNKTQPLHIYGPADTKAMTNGMIQMFQKDYVHRSNDLFKQSYLDMEVTEFTEEGIIYDDGDVKIRVFNVEHGDGNPAYGYRFEYKQYTVLLSGDTTYHENILKWGKDCDCIIHNVIGIHPDISENYKPVIAKLTTPEQAADIFCQTKPRLAVFSHICKKGLSGLKGDRQIIDRVRQAGYTGELVMGYDRMKIEIGPQVTVYEPVSIENLEDLQ